MPSMTVCLTLQKGIKTEFQLFLGWRLFFFSIMRLNIPSKVAINGNNNEYLNKECENPHGIIAEPIDQCENPHSIITEPNDQ